MSIAREKMLSLFVLLCMSLPILAQTGSRNNDRRNVMTDSVHHIKEVVVLGMSMSQSDIVPAQILTGDELHQMNSLSVADALRYFSGVQLKDYGGIGGIKTVNIRSMGTNHMGVYYNGIELGNAQNGQIDLGKYSLENIEAIKLYNGQKSDIFQSAREFGSAGSIYLVTRHPRFENGKTTNVRASYKGGSFGLVNPSFYIEHQITKDISLNADAEWINSSGKYKFRYRRVTPSGELAYDTTATRQNGDIDAMRVEGGLYGNINNGTWNVQVYHYSSERGVPGAIVNNVWRRGERLWDRNTFIQGQLQRTMTKLWSVRVNTKYAYDYTRYVNNDDKLIHVDNIYKQKELYFSLANLFNITSFWKASAAYDFQYNKLSEYMNVHRATHWISAATSLELWHRLRAQVSVLGTIVKEEKRDRDQAPMKSKLTSGAFLSYEPIDGLELRAFAKRSYRMPTFNDLYYTDMGNAYLKPETADQYDGGITFHKEYKGNLLEAFRLSTDVYYNKVKDKIVAYPKGQQFRWTMLNLGRVHIKGLDAQASFLFHLPADVMVTTKLQYTYQDAIDVTNPADNYYRDQIPYIPWNSGSAVVMCEWRGWHLNYSFIYTGERYNQQENIEYNYTQPWYTSDLSLQKDFQWRRCRLRVSAEVNNLFSQDYDVILNYPMPKRNYRFGVTVEF